MSSDIPPHEIHIEIAKNGTLKSTVVGISGPACAQASAWLDNLGTVTHDSPTDAFFKEGQGETQRQTNHTKQQAAE